MATKPTPNPTLFQGQVDDPNRYSLSVQSDPGIDENFGSVDRYYEVGDVGPNGARPLTWVDNERVNGQQDWNRLAGLANQARNRPQTNIDRYWLDQDIAQGQESRGLQQQGLAGLRMAAEGNAPSQAQLMANMARGRAAGLGVGATGGLAARQAALSQNQAMSQAAMQGAAARSDEIGRSTGAYLGGTGAMMSGDLRNRNASGDEAYNAARIGLRDKEMAAKYGLDYEKLRQGKQFGDIGRYQRSKEIEDQYLRSVNESNKGIIGQMVGGISGMAGGITKMFSGITTKTDISPAASSPKMGAALQPDQISAAFGPEVAAAVARSRAKYQPQNALAQMPQFSPDVAVAPALARSNDVPVDLSAMQANASVPSDVRAKKDIEMSGKSGGATGKPLMVGQPAPMPRLAEPQEPSWIPIAQTGGLARIHSDERSKKTIDFMAKFIRENTGYNVNTSPGEGGGVAIYKPEPRRGAVSESKDKPDTEGKGVSASTGKASASTFEYPVYPSGSSKPIFVEDPKKRSTSGAEPYKNEPNVFPSVSPMIGEEPFGYGYRPSFGTKRPAQKPTWGVLSDKNQKTGGPGARTADAFLDSLADSASTYRYKDPSMEPSTTGGTGGKYLGIMAQRVEQTPEIGHQLVKDTPQGKVVEGQAMLSALAGGLGRLHQKVKEMEGRRGR